MALSATTRHRLGQVKQLAKSQTAKNSSIVFAGNLINAALSLVAVIYVSRELGPVNFGVLATFNALMATLIGLTNLGLDTAAIKLISTYMETNRRRASIIMKSIFWLEILIGLVLGLVGLFFSKIIATSLGGEQLLFAVQLAFVASIFGSAAAFVGPFFIAYQQFTKNALVGLIGGVMRTGLILLLAVTVGLNLNNVLWVYAAVPVVFFFAGLALAPKDWIIKTQRQEDKSALQEIFHFSKWILLSYVATVLAGKLDVFLLSSLKGSETVGLYAAAIQLCLIMPLLIGAISTALLPQLSRYTTRGQFTSYIKKAFFGATVLTIALLPVLIFGQFLIEVVFGSKYSGAFDAFRIMFIGYLIALYANPLGLILYALNKPSRLTTVNYAQLALAILLNITLIPIFGIVGAALAFLGVNLLGGTASIYFAIKEVRKLPE